MTIYAVPGSSGLAVPIATVVAGTPVLPGIAADLTMRFPRPEFVTGILLVPRPIVGIALEANAAKLAVMIIDEQANLLASDSRGTAVLATSGELLQVAIEGLALNGRGWRPFALQRPVATGDKWTLQLQNRDTVNAQRLAGLYIFTEAG